MLPGARSRDPDYVGSLSSLSWFNGNHEPEVCVAPEVVLNGLICPSGNVRARIENLSSPVSKNISLFPKPKSDVSMTRPVPARGAFRDRHERGAGCGGRGGIERRTMLAADGEVVWS
jgi:hypothetical protein